MSYHQTTPRSSRKPNVLVTPQRNEPTSSLVSSFPHSLIHLYSHSFFGFLQLEYFYSFFNSHSFILFSVNPKDPRTPILPYPIPKCLSYFRVANVPLVFSRFTLNQTLNDKEIDAPLHRATSWLFCFAKELRKVGGSRKLRDCCVRFL